MFSELIDRSVKWKLVAHHFDNQLIFFSQAKMSNISLFQFCKCKDLPLFFVIYDVGQKEQFEDDTLRAQSVVFKLLMRVLSQFLTFNGLND